MANEPGGMDPYEVVLADLKAKRAQLDQAIAAIEAIRGNAPSGAAQNPTPAPSSAESQRSPSTTVTAGMFHGMSISDAAKQLLAMRKAPMGTQELTEALLLGGIVFTTETPANTVGSVMNRQTKIGTEIISVGRGKWALAAWFPDPSRFRAKRPERNGDVEPGNVGEEEEEEVAEAKLGATVPGAG